MAESKVVTPEMVADVSARLKDLDGVDREIALAKRAGIDVTDAEKKSQELRQQLARIKQTYGPGSI